MRISVFELPEHKRGRAHLVLALSFLLGHFWGIWFSGMASEQLSSATRMAAWNHVSVFGLLSSTVLPFLFSAFAVYLKQPILLIPIAFVKAFLFSYVGYHLWMAWGSAGWLIRGLMMFGTGLSMPVLYWYWQRYIDGRGFQWEVFLLTLGFLLVIGMVDYQWVAPFLIAIITF